MESLSLTAVADEQLARARQSNSGRSAHTIYGGHEHFLRQTVIALVGGRELAEHESPGEATLQVVTGAVKVSCRQRVLGGRRRRFPRHSRGAAQPSGGR